MIDYWHDFVASAVPVEAQADDPVRKETWTPRECRTHEYDWGLWAGDPDQDGTGTRGGPLTVVYLRPEEHEEVAYQGQHYDRNHDEPGTTYPVFEITFAARECRSYRYAWDQTRNSGPERDPRIGQREPGTYEVEAIWEADWTGRPEGHHAAMHGTSPRFELR